MIRHLDPRPTTLMVWIHMLPGDRIEAAAAQAEGLPAEGLHHFHDPRRRVGKALSPAVGAGRAVVWDTYLFFASGARWSEGPPAPEDWAHQLDAGWADPARFRWGDDLTAWLHQATRRPSQPHQP